MRISEDDEDVTRPIPKSREDGAVVTPFAFLGRVSTEDNQDPEVSRGWQIDRAQQLITQVDGAIVAEYFDIGQSRALPWKRRPQASALLEAIKDPDRPFDAVVIGEPQRAFYGNQFSLTFPVLAHYGVELWVPEVGGRVDPGSDSHDMVMTMFGGMSKAERTRIQLRTKAAMTHLATHTDRFLGGRPPYGYRLVDAGAHPNPAKAADGKRLHRLEPDPVTAPVVQQIFAMYAAGKSLREIADALIADKIPSPSAYDRARNPHRDPVGWAHHTVKNLLENPIYVGHRAWGKQRKQEVLIDPDDVAAGSQTRMRWNAKDTWLNSDVTTNEALISNELRDQVQDRARARQHGRQNRRPTAGRRIYALRGLIECAACGHRMQATYQAPRTKNAAERIFYRCELAKLKRSLPADAFPDHPKTINVRESLLLPRLDQWIGTVARADAFRPLPVTESEFTRTSRHLREELQAHDQAVQAIVEAIEIAGSDIPELASALLRHTKQRDIALAALTSLRFHPQARPEPDRAARRLADLAAGLPDADPAERFGIYTKIGLKLVYHHGPERRLQASLDINKITGRPPDSPRQFAPLTTDWLLDDPAMSSGAPKRDTLQT